MSLKNGFRPYFFISFGNFGLGRSIEPSCFVTEFLPSFVCTIVVTEFYRVLPSFCWTSLGPLPSFSLDWVARLNQVVSLPSIYLVLVVA